MSVIMIIIPYVSGLYVSSVRNLAIDRNEIVASLLAEEGLELMRNVRDTDFLRFTQKTQSCWDTAPGAATSSTCDINPNRISDKIKALTGNPALPAWFTIGLDPVPANFPIMLSQPLNEALDSAAPLEQYKLWLDEDSRPASPTCALGDPNCHKDFRDDTHIYTTVQRGVPTFFYRGIKIQFSNDLKRMHVESTVIYPNGKDMVVIRRAKNLTNTPKAE